MTEPKHPARQLLSPHESGCSCDRCWLIESLEAERKKRKEAEAELLALREAHDLVMRQNRALGNQLRSALSEGDYLRDLMCPVKSIAGALDERRLMLSFDERSARYNPKQMLSELTRVLHGMFSVHIGMRV